MSFLPSDKSYFIIPVVLIFVVVMKFLFNFGLKEILTIAIVMIMATGLYRIYEFKSYKSVIYYNSKEISFSGKITDIKEYTGDKGSYTVKGKINGKERAEIIVYADLYDCRINDYFKFKGTVKTFENDYLFASKDFYKSRGIFLTTDELKSYEITANNRFSVTWLLKEYTDYVTDFINKNLPEQSGTMLSAMIFGDTSLISSDDKTLFYRTGIGHIMAVSGQHLVIFCGIFIFFLDRTKISRLKKFLFLEIMIIAFSICSGMSPSVLRSAVMMTLVNLAPLFNRKADTLNSICVSFILLTAFNPFSIKDPSLILSVTGTFGAGVFAPYLTDKMKSDTFINRQLKGIVYMFLVSLSVLPFSIIFFGESSFISPIMNIILSPLCMIVLLLVLIAALTIFVEPVFLIKIAGFLCDVVMECVKFVGKFKFSGMNMRSEMIYVSVGVIIFCIIAYLIFKSRKALMISVAISMIVSVCVTGLGWFLSADKLNIALLGDKSIDVMVITKGSNATVIDISGRKKNYRYALKFLQKNNIDSLNGIFIKSNPLQAMSTYNKGFSLIDVGNVFLPIDTYVRDDMKICGYTPEFMDYKDENIIIDNVKININGTRIVVKYGEFEFICDNNCNDEEALVYAEYENIFNPPESTAVIVPEYENISGVENIVTDRNICVIAESDGSFRIGGL